MSRRLGTARVLAEQYLGLGGALAGGVSSSLEECWSSDEYLRCHRQQASFAGARPSKASLELLEGYPFTSPSMSDVIVITRDNRQASNQMGDQLSSAVL